MLVIRFSALVNPIEYQGGNADPLGLNRYICQRNIISPLGMF